MSVVEGDTRTQSAVLYCYSSVYMCMLECTVNRSSSAVSTCACYDQSSIVCTFLEAFSRCIQSTWQLLWYMQMIDAFLVHGVVVSDEPGSTIVIHQWVPTTSLHYHQGAITNQSPDYFTKVDFLGFWKRKWFKWSNGVFSNSSSYVYMCMGI